MSTGSYVYDRVSELSQDNLKIVHPPQNELSDVKRDISISVNGRSLGYEFTAVAILSRLIETNKEMMGNLQYKTSCFLCPC